MGNSDSLARTNFLNAIEKVHPPQKAQALLKRFEQSVSEVLMKLEKPSSDEVFEVFFDVATTGIEKEINTDKEVLRNIRRQQGVFIKSSSLKPWFDLMTLILRIQPDGSYGKNDNCSLSKAADYTLIIKNILGCISVKPDSAEFLTIKHSLLQKYRAHRRNFVITEYGILNLYEVIKTERKGKQIKKLVSV